ncbi:heterotrimeric G-protein alpha subunit (G-alpha, GPA2) [Melampsora larici-populina 98AG31]|uniref:Guanine nucleotide-binding protein alpha-2 subunit n=1 Tax=Melampsora larici-populina (strain 98AG31 / pathotype 3-4-7) TaxID=747676 RepID=F4RED5_MELLP|nr:heterotrimeric G-protein alpha subunit (G-alpha, GPA2) [Melampsora larici-populina 98AG31]EGG09074.1 heterotrimeric G-protein alpha subunit (G-alpha, GPA2) [Melampsora larici-populina 98AG31]
MGNCFSTSSAGDPHSKNSKTIDRRLKEDEKRMAKEVKILLLGAGESGKTTVLKQMQIVHNRGGFTATQKEEYRQQVFINVCDGMKVCLEVMSREQIELEDETLMDCVPLFSSYTDLNPGQPYPTQYLEPLKRLWVDGGVRKAMDLGHEWAMPENMHYFFPDLDRLFNPNYIPTDQDILYCRGKTTGITETTFTVSELKYRMFDVGGQRSERKKWIHCFEGVTAVLFLVAISGYDATLLEDGDANQMQEALMLFDTITNSQWFTQTSMILFLNKTDLFKQKLFYSPISRYFPDYVGDDTDYEASRSYFKDRFVRLNRSSKKEIYTHYTCATDTSLMRVVMASVTDIIITRNLQSIIL